MNDLDSSEYDVPKGSTERTILAVVLSLAVYLLWAKFIAQKPATQEIQSQPSTTVVKTEMAVPPIKTPLSNDSAVPIPKILPKRTFPWKGVEWEATLSTQGGALKNLMLPGYESAVIVTPIYSWLWKKVSGSSPGPWSPYVQPTEPVTVISSSGFFGESGGMEDGFNEGDYEVVEETAERVVLKRTNSNGLQVTKEFVKGADANVGSLIVRFENTSTLTLVGRLWVGVSDDMKSYSGRYENIERPVGTVLGKLKKGDNIEDYLKDGPRVFHGSVSWFGVHNRYFLAALVPDDPNWGNLVFSSHSKIGDMTRAGSYLVREGVSLKPGEQQVVRFLSYVGPKDSSRLSDLGHDLQKAVDFGWFGFFARVLLWLLQAIHSISGNWGVAIIGLTLLVKLAFFPLTQKAIKSSKEMQKLQPILAEIREKYKDNKEMQTQETMRLFQEHGVNPMGGCLPTLIQLPVWIALYNVLLSSVDLYHSHFFVFKDLSSPDPYAVLPLIVGGLMFLQQKMTPMTGMDPTQARIMQFMPLIFIFFIFSFPSGLGIYITVNSVLSIIQQWIINRKYKVPVPAA